MSYALLTPSLLAALCGTSAARLRRLALDLWDLAHLYGRQPVGPQEAARIFLGADGQPIGGPSLLRRWERWKSHARELALPVDFVRAYDADLEVSSLLLVRLRPEARTWAGLVLDCLAGGDA